MLCKAALARASRSWLVLPSILLEEVWYYFLKSGILGGQHMAFSMHAVGLPLALLLVLVLAFSVWLHPLDQPQVCTAGIESGLSTAGGPPWHDGAAGPAEHLRNIFGRMGFSDQEHVVLAGAHSLSYVPPLLHQICNQVS